MRSTAPHIGRIASSSCTSRLPLCKPKPTGFALGLGVAWPLWRPAAPPVAISAYRSSRDLCIVPSCATGQGGNKRRGKPRKAAKGGRQSRSERRPAASDNGGASDGGGTGGAGVGTTAAVGSPAAAAAGAAVGAGQQQQQQGQRPPLGAAAAPPPPPPPAAARGAVNGSIGSGGRPLTGGQSASASAPTVGTTAVVLERILPASPPQRYHRKQRRTKPIWLVMAVAVALIDDDGLVLMAQRPANKHFGGTWEFPGGKMEPRETPEQAAAREMLEEVGVTIHPADLTPLTFASHSYPNGVTHLLLPLFVCRRWQGEAAGCEGQQIAWVHESDLEALPMPPADVSLIPAVRAAIRDRANIGSVPYAWPGGGGGRSGGDRSGNNSGGSSGGGGASKRGAHG